MVFTKLAESSWRTLLFWLGPPGLVIAGLALLTLAEPRKAQGNPLASLLAYFRPAPLAQQTIEELSAQQYAKVGFGSPLACTIYSRLRLRLYGKSNLGHVCTA